MKTGVEQPAARRRKSPDWRLLRYLATHLGLGAASGWIFVAALLYFDVGGIGALAMGSPAGPLAVIMLLIVMTITWGSAAMGTAVFLLPRDEGDDGGGKKQPARSLRPALAFKAAKSGGRAVAR